MSPRALITVPATGHRRVDKRSAVHQRWRGIRWTALALVHPTAGTMIKASPRHVGRSFRGTHTDLATWREIGSLQTPRPGAFATRVRSSPCGATSRAVACPGVRALNLGRRWASAVRASKGSDGMVRSRYERLSASPRRNSYRCSSRTWCTYPGTRAAGCRWGRCAACR